MMLLHKMQLIADITRGEKRWAAPQELGGMFVQELRGLTVGILGVRFLSSPLFLSLRRVLTEGKENSTATSAARSPVSPPPSVRAS